MTKRSPKMAVSPILGHISSLFIHRLPKNCPRNAIIIQSIKGRLVLMFSKLIIMRGQKATFIINFETKLCC